MLRLCDPDWLCLNSRFAVAGQLGNVLGDERAIGVARQHERHLQRQHSVPANGTALFSEYKNFERTVYFSTV